MATAPASRILLCADCAVAVNDLRPVLESAGFAPRWHALEVADLQELAGYNLVVLDSGQREQQALQLCRRLHSSLPERWLPVLLITADRNPALRMAGVECGVDGWLIRPFAPEEFLSQVNTILRWKREYDGLTEKAAEVRRVHQQLQNAYREGDHNLELSRRIQQRLMPRTLPDMPPAHFAVRHHSCGRSGGDSYHIFRLGDDQIGFYLADVVGHGVSASLLTLFLKLAFSSNEILGFATKLMAPHEQLQRLNRELLELSVVDSPLITMVYALFDRRNHSLSFARAGSPHPIHVPRVGEPNSCPLDGTLLGVFDTQFTTSKLRLRSGDKVLFYSDGLDGLASDGMVSGVERLRTLIGRYRTLPVREFVDRLFTDLLASSPSDDLTVLGLEIAQTRAAG